MSISFIGSASRFRELASSIFVMIPSGTELGDLLVVFLGTNGSTNTVTAPGWTIVEVPTWVFHGSPFPSAGNIFALVKFADADDVEAGALGPPPFLGGPWVVATPIDAAGAGQTGDFTLLTLCYRDAPVLPNVAVRGTDPFGTAHTIPGGILSPDADAIVIAGGHISQDRADTVTAAGFTERGYEAGGSFATPVFALDEVTGAVGLVGPWPATSDVADTIHWIVLLAPALVAQGLHIDDEVGAFG